MQGLRLIVALVCLMALLGQPAFVAAQTGAPVKIATAQFTKVVDWNTGTSSNILITNNEDGELRLAAGATQGVFESGLLPLDFTAHAVGASWQATVLQGTKFSIELRGGPSGDAMGDWYALAAGDSRAKDDTVAIESLIALPADSAFLQLRVTLSSTVTNASPELRAITLTYFDASAGPAQAAGLKPVALMAGTAALTYPPQVIERRSWSANAPQPATITRQQPRGVVLHQLLTANTASLPYMRALLAYQVKTLGWPDLPFHYLIDQEGVIYEGAAGGPTAAIPRGAAADSVVHVAFLGGGTPSDQARSSFAQLIGWLGQAYAIEPLGKHSFTSSDGKTIERENIVGHSEIAPGVIEPNAETINLLPELRKAADAATVRARWYFAEGNPENYGQRIAVLNPTNVVANLRFILLRQPGPTVIRETTVPAGGRADLLVNDLFNDTNDVPIIVESNQPVLAERYMDFESDISMTVGTRTLARVWYFAEGATDDTNRTFLVLFNPQSAEATATVSYIRDNGLVDGTQKISIPPGRRVVVSVGDALNGARFGMRVVATRPIVAERTMIFGPGSTLETGGVHTTAGVTELSRRWYFAEGTTDGGFQMDVMVLNPNNQTAHVAVTFMTSDGTSLTRRYAIPPTTRQAINVNEVVPQLGVATTVESDRPVVAERTISWNNGQAGTASPGATQTAYTWRFVDGRTSDNFQEFLLINNPGKNQARVTVEYVLADGSKVSDAPFVMPAGSRQTVAVHQLHGGQAAISATVRSSQLIVVERSLYRGNPRSADNRGGETVLGIPGDTP